MKWKNEILLKDLLRSVGSRTNEFKPLSRDPWIRANSEIEPQRLQLAYRHIERVMDALQRAIPGP
jgi:hypothetical protein